MKTAGMHVPSQQWVFGPHYFLAVFALATHVGCAWYWNLPDSSRRRALAGAMVSGLLLATCLVVLLAGGFHALEIPTTTSPPWLRWWHSREDARVLRRPVPPARGCWTALHRS